jgi:hypothetical protein
MDLEGALPETISRPACGPATLLRIYLYSHLNLIRSSRRLERDPQARLGAASQYRLPGQEVPLTHGAQGMILAAAGGRPAASGPIAAYVAKAFGQRLAEVREAMEALAARFEPKEFNRVALASTSGSSLICQQNSARPGRQGRT